MSNPSLALASRLDWRKVFQLIGLDEPRSSDLPQAMPCPLCDVGALTVMSDHVLNSLWFHCSDCQFAGDLIEFSAKILKCSIGGCINFLETHQLFEMQLRDVDLANYRTQQIDLRLRIRKFWETAKHAPSEPATVGATGSLVLRRYCLGDFIYQDHWRERGGQLFGIAQRQVIEDLFAPLSFAEQDRLNRQGRSSRRRGGGPGKRRLFEGHNWNEVLVIAHSDLPGRIIGFTFIGGVLDNPQIVFKRINLGCCVSQPRESGLGFLEALNGAPHPQFGQHVFVFLDPEVATLLHSRHLRESCRPLPVLLARSSRNFRPLHLPPDLDDCKLIFCGPLMDTLPLAKAHNGSVSTYEIPEAEVQDNLKRRDPVSFLWQFQKQPIPWVSALRRLLPSLPKAQADVLLDSLELSPRESEKLQQGLGGSAGERFSDLTPHRLRGKQIPVGSFTVEETSEGWIARKPGVEQLICNPPIRIETIYRTESRDVAYGIAVRRENDTLRLMAVESDLKRSTLFDFVAVELRNGFNEHLEFIRHKWARLSMSLALQFSKPEIIPYAGRVGWNPSRLRFQFPQFAILNNGEIDTTPMPAIHKDRDVPGTELATPFSCRQSVAMLSRATSETQLIWALAACVAHNLLAGNCTREPVGVVLDGAFAHETGERAARALGCGSVHTLERGNESVFKFISTQCGAHDFPSVVDFGTNSRLEITTAWIDAPQLRRAILSLPTYAAIAVSLHRGFVRIRSHELPLPLGPLSSATGWIIAAYLEDVCRRKKLIEFRANQNEIISVLHDMAEWLERCGGDPKTVLAGEKLLVFDFNSPATAFVELVERMRSEGDIVTIVGHTTEAVRSKTPGAIVEPSGDDIQSEPIQIRHVVINEVLRRKRTPAIRTDDIQADLETLSAWRGMIDQDDQDSIWLIDADWWNRTAAAIRRKPRRSPATFRKVAIDGPTEGEDSAEPCVVFDDSTP